jgi:hypothetical protein
MAGISKTPGKYRADVNKLDNGKPQTVTMRRASDGATVTPNYTQEDMAVFRPLGFVEVTESEQLALDTAQAKSKADKEAEALATKTAAETRAADIAAMLDEALPKWRAQRDADAKAKAKAKPPA